MKLVLEIGLQKITFEEKDNISVQEMSELFKCMLVGVGYSEQEVDNLFQEEKNYVYRQNYN